MRPLPVHGRGAGGNPANRFQPLEVEGLDEVQAREDGPETRFLRDRSRSIVTTNDSPDVGFRASLNPYRGCEHGCAYCYARPTHEYLGFSAGLDFESRILVKENAPELLREELADPGWEPTPLALSGVTDAYQPLERELEVTRRCLEVLAEARHPVAVVTKSRLVARDRDLLAKLAGHGAARVHLSITTLDEELRRVLEPRVPTPESRLDAVRKLADAGVPTGVMIAPVIPGLTEHEVPSLLEAAAAAGARHASWVLLRLPHGVEELFVDWLEKHRPERKEKVLGRLRDLRGGRLIDPRFGSRMRGEGPMAESLAELFRLARREHGLDEEAPALSTGAFRRPAVDGAQTELFGPG